ncbi:LuxR C-terminal-related transcriptional regulator [Methylosinus sp. LW4]|uniref:LuxR C-terminal-related transcriptional regulator n=1 Tax=Methylosinus sp. LW4 TaxID=136993 RepID=UPI00036A93B7|nr:LuxR C-terminal-related transcriptional regulator [Methylosinus sp. LW4]
MTHSSAPTPTESRVLALAAEGMTDREIAKRLGMNFRTVISHRHRAQLRMGLTRRPLSRAEIAVLKAALRTNGEAKEIAAALGRSRRTVEAHFVAIRACLGVDSKDQALALFARRSAEHAPH